MMSNAVSKPDSCRVSHIRHRITVYKVFISHRYIRSSEYLRLSHMLDRVSRHDATWRWENLSVPVDAPIMTADEARIANIYEERIRERLAQVHVILFPLRDDWLESESLYLELVECAAAYRYRPRVPIVCVLPRGGNADALQHAPPGDVTVGWNARSIVSGIRAHALPVSVDELLLTPTEAEERAHIVAALVAHQGNVAGACAALGISMSTLRRRRLTYIIR